MDSCWSWSRTVAKGTVSKESKVTGAPLPLDKLVACSLEAYELSESKEIAEWFTIPGVFKVLVVVLGAVVEETITGTQFAQKTVGTHEQFPGFYTSAISTHACPVASTADHRQMHGMVGEISCTRPNLVLSVQPWYSAYYTLHTALYVQPRYSAYNPYSVYIPRYSVYNPCTSFTPLWSVYRYILNSVGIWSKIHQSRMTTRVGSNSWESFEWLFPEFKNSVTVIMTGINNLIELMKLQHKERMVKKDTQHAKQMAVLMAQVKTRDVVDS